MTLVSISIVLAALTIGALLYFMNVYNSLVRVKNEVDRAWANIEVLLKQRHDEIPKLISSVESYMQYEKGLIEKVVEARSLWQRAQTVGQKTEASKAESSALKSFFAIAENYPDLKANTNFVQFQQRISSIEEHLSDRREFYNAAVNNYNIRIEQIPDVIIASNLGYREKPLFQVSAEEQEDPKISFKNVS